MSTKALDLDGLFYVATWATPGPWRQEITGKLCEVRTDNGHHGEFIGRHMTAENAHYIACADPATILTMIAEIQSLRDIAVLAARMRKCLTWDTKGNSGALLWDKECEHLHEIIGAYDKTAPPPPRQRSNMEPIKGIVDQMTEALADIERRRLELGPLRQSSMDARREYDRADTALRNAEERYRKLVMTYLPQEPVSHPVNA